MNREDRQALAAIRYAAEQDELVREDIHWAIEYHDRAFFEQVVHRVVKRLRLTVSDTRRFIDAAYEWFRRQL